ncbi:hypothetical protein [Bacillus haynesii]|nr:hypothetical protein [Bacillus haynesii]
MSFRNWPVIQFSLSFGIAKKSGSVSIGRIASLSFSIAFSQPYF